MVLPAMIYIYHDLVFCRGTTCGKAGPSMAAIVGPRKPSTVTKFAVDGPAGPVVAGDHLRYDSSYGG